MNRPIKEIKRIARGNLINRYRIPMQVYIRVLLLTFLFDLPFSLITPEYPTQFQMVLTFLSQFVVGLALVIFEIGQIHMHIAMARHQDINADMVLWGFKNHPDRLFIVGIVVSIAQLLFTIPIYILNEVMNQTVSQFGFKGLNFEAFIQADNLSLLKEKLPLILGLACGALVAYIFVSLLLQLPYYFVADFEGMPAKLCLKYGIETMKGHRGRLLLLMISFIGMDFLVVLSLGIASLWVVPYKQQTYALFYLDILGEVPSTIDHVVTDSTPETASQIM